VWGGASAVSAALIFAAANLLWVFSQPQPGASSNELLAFYDGHSTEVVVAALLSLVSYALLIGFASALRPILVDIEGDEILGNVAFGATIFAVAAGAGAETVNMAAGFRATDSELTGALATVFFDISYVFGSYVFAVGLGLLLFATSAVAVRRAALLPRWLAAVGLLISITLITPLAVVSAGVWALGPPVVFIFAVGCLLLAHEHGGPAPWPQAASGPN
jgi:hypothetical protein